MTVSTPSATCPNCGAAHGPDALFCEECAYDFTGGQATTDLANNGSLPHSASETQRRQAQVATPVTAEKGEESPLDIGWTGAVSRESEPLTAPVATVPVADPTTPNCTECGQGTYTDGYCDNCGAKQRDPRDHFTEDPQPWVAGVCDIGIRHSRNEDAMALYADASQLSFAVLVVCDGVSNSTDSHIASLAASRAARAVLDDPVPRGMGTRTAIVSAIEQRLDDSVQAARDAVIETTADRTVENPPSCTFVAALIDHGVAVVGNVGDSRAYWLPDNPDSAPRQLSRDDSFADEQIRAGVPRKEAETAAGAHAITRWLGSDSPDDLTPHTTDLDLDEDGWLAVVSDGLWNYCSEAADLQLLVHDTVARLGPHGHHPPTLAQALTDFANERGGIDNITVALARVGSVDRAPEPPPAPEPPTPEPLTPEPPTPEAIPDQPFAVEPVPTESEASAPETAPAAGEPSTAPGSSYSQTPDAGPPGPSPAAPAPASAPASAAPAAPAAPAQPAPAPTANPVAPVDPVHGADDGKDTP